MLLTNCRVLPSMSPFTQATLADVEIEEGKIKTVKPAQSTQASGSCIDCGGKTLLPGLIDLHTHITVLCGVGVGHEDDHMRLFIDAAKQAARYLDYGFTTIRDCGSPHRVANYIRDAIAEGLFDGPQILSCGKIVEPSVERPDEIINPADGVDGFRRCVREEVAAKADFIKIYNSGSAFSRSTRTDYPIMELEEVQKAVETARVNGLYVAAHCHADSAIRDCILSGVKTIEHATYIRPKTVELLDRARDCYLVPTFAALYISQTDPAERMAWERLLNPMLEKCVEGIGLAYRAGKKLGFGTDSAPGGPQYEKGVEFTMRRELCGMKNLDILLQATKYSAEIAGLNNLGDIQEGMTADLILVDGNPDEDISIMGRKPLKVWKNGNLIRGTAN